MKRSQDDVVEEEALPFMEAKALAMEMAAAKVREMATVELAEVVGTTTCIPSHARNKVYGLICHINSGGSDTLGIRRGP